jgi:Fe-S cluster assembly ATP-binding protein
MLNIHNLTVSAGQQLILDQISLEIKAGEIHVLLGPNGSGKSSLAQVIIGNPQYQVESGQVIFQGQDITQLPMAARAKLGIALTFQNPPQIPGVSLQKLLKSIRSSHRDDLQQPRQSAVKRDSAFGQELLQRDLNVDFSGGEKKMAEVLQILALQPQFVIFDELDSGLDIKNLARISKIIKGQIIDQNLPVLFITHHGQIVNGLQPDWTHVMLDKEIICSSQDYQRVITTIQKHDYRQCRQCQSAHR